MPTLKTRLIANSAVWAQVPVQAQVEDSPMPGRLVCVSLESPGTQLFLELSMGEARALVAALASEIRQNEDNWAPNRTWVRVS